MLLGGNCRYKRCCCCDIKVGTTIIGLLDIIASIISIVVLATIDDEYNNKDNIAVQHFRERLALPLNPTTKTIFSIIAIISLIISSFMVYGNIKGKWRFMSPWVYWNLANLALTTILMIIAISGSSGARTGMEILIQLVSLVTVIVFNLMFIQVVRSRIADIEEGNRPDIPFTQRIPAN